MVIAGVMAEIGDGRGTTVTLEWCDSRTSYIYGLDAEIQSLLYPTFEDVMKPKHDSRKLGEGYNCYEFSCKLANLRFRLQDHLNGRGWELIGYSVTYDHHTTVHFQIWRKAK